MHLHIDEYAHLDSAIHRWNPRAKFISLFALIIAFSLVQDLRFVPLMLAVTAVLFGMSRLPFGFLISRLRYPGVFLGALIVILPFFTGNPDNIVFELGVLSVKAEGLTYMLLVVSRFIAILTVSLVIFGTTTFLTTVYTLRSMGIPSIMADMLLLTVRYVFDIADTLVRMQRAMRLRGFQMSRLDGKSISRMVSLIASLLIRSYEQSERVYKSMRLRGYGIAKDTDEEITMTAQATPQAAEPAALQLKDLRFTYPGRPAALNGVDLTIRPGERVGLIGPNGAGKTSLFLSVCGVLKPDSGTVSVFGESIAAGTFTSSIGLVFQNSDDQLFSPTVQEDIAFGPVNLGLDDATVEERVAEAVRLTGTEHLLERAPHHLSGGEKRMVSIASVLAMRPGLVLYDEPDANLDMRSRRRLIQFLQEAPHTLIIASHDLEMVLEVCDRVILLDGGEVVANGNSREIMANVTLMEKHGLEKPHSLVPHIHGDGTIHESMEAAQFAD